MTHYDEDYIEQGEDMGIKHTPGPWHIEYSYQSHFGPGSHMCKETCGKGEIPRRVRAINEKEDGRGWNPAWTELHEMEPGSIEMIKGSDGSVILGLGQGYDDLGTAPNDADARLIVAAPDLLDALKRLVRVGCCAGEGVIEAEAAIAKAEGR